ncbi:MAG: two-component regulator propeller domain-containing protein [Ferruginibacter sp.]
MNSTFVIRALSIVVTKAVLFCTCLTGQSIFFNHLNTTNGLTDNDVKCMTVDKNGFLWMGTIDGLNVYDGYTVISYFKKQEPFLASDNAGFLACDENNRIWIGSRDGVSWVDGNRKFHRVTLLDSITKFTCLHMLETKKYGRVLYTDLGPFYYDTTAGKWLPITWITDKFRYEKMMDVTPFSDNQVIYTMDSIVAILDYSTQKIIYEASFVPLLSTCRASNDEIAIGLQTGKVNIVNIRTKQLLKQYEITAPFNKQKINTNLTHIQSAANGDILVSTGFAGLVVISKTGQITRHVHDPLNPRSISANNTIRVLAQKNGDVFVATNTAGINVCNIYNKQAAYTAVFSNAAGELFDNYLNEMIEDSDGTIWIGAYDRLIQWDKKKQQSRYYYYFMQNPLQGLRTVEIRSLCFDKDNRLWLSASGGGVAVLDKTTGTMIKVPHDTSKGPALRSHYIHDLLPASDGNIWACTNTGVFSINPANLQINTYDKHPVLNIIAAKRTTALFEDRDKNIWFAVPAIGICRYQPAQNKMVQFTVKDGLVSNLCYSFKQDRQGNMYVASAKGFSILKTDGTIKAFTKQNGLRYDMCEGFLDDSAGNIWVANNKCLIKYDPVTGKMEYYDENAGLSVLGFRQDCFVKTRSGEMLWGGRKGLNYFYPDDLVNNPGQIKLSINKAVLRDSVSRITSSRSFELAYDNNSVQFHFAAINLLGSRQIAYLYKLDGFDKEWQTGIDITEARYASLLPGKYTFRVRASIDRIHWVNSTNDIKVTIVPPIWIRWWFLTGCIILAIAIIYAAFALRNRKIRLQREELETQKAINYFASSMYQQHTVDMILWDVAKNCIGRLHFEDAVIYLLDEERNVLVQKAAHGPKSPEYNEISKPIDIPLGKGIVGSVAATGIGEIIPDTTKDSRYIVDDVARLSEISVPIISDGKILGVIDCEHSNKKYFTQKHLNILTTIASLCANKIVRARAEEERAHAEKILVDTQGKMAEVEMQALRAQMNPHFIFNCLNSINRYIVKSDQATASLYLTRFAKLIRLILDNSNTKNVILSNELEALRLYIEMEALRFDKKFTYQVIVDNNVNTDSVEVPPLIIQPYVENAIWHGLLHKESCGQLTIRMRMISESMLECIIEDNGVGREKARIMRSKSATTRKSLGMQLTESRISLLNKHAALNASIEIIDLENEAHEADGTKVILNIPV